MFCFSALCFGFLSTVFSGHWGRLLEVLERGLGGLRNGADLISFRDFCTPDKSWPWAKWMHEGWHNLTAPGQGLETWMTAYGLSPTFLALAAEEQAAGRAGHIEWFPPTLALRRNASLVFVEHDLRGARAVHACPGDGAQRGGTFNYCCQAKKIPMESLPNLLSPFPV